MKEIFQRMMRKEFDDKMLLSEAYSVIQGINRNWIHCDDCSIKEQCHRICDELEQEGEFLEEISVDVIGDRFDKIKFSINYPPKYLQLLKNLEYVEEQKSKLEKLFSCTTKQSGIN